MNNKSIHLLPLVFFHYVYFTIFIVEFYALCAKKREIKRKWNEGCDGKEKKC